MAPTRNRRPGFSRRAQYGLFLSYVIAVAGALVGAVLLALSTLDPPAFAALRQSMSEATTPISSGLAGIGRWFGTIPGNISSYIAVHDENARLKKQITGEHALIMRARALSYDNRRLMALLKLRERTSDAVVAARLVSSSASSTRRTAMLNAGSWQGVREGQPVRAADGLIGRVLEVGPNSARILLLTDPESIVPARRTRDGLPAMISGRGDGLLDIKSVNLASADFRPGDVFMTTGAGGIFAPNIPVARVVSTTRDGALGRAMAEPTTLDWALVQQAFMNVPPQGAPLP